MANPRNAWLYALGGASPPDAVRIGEQTYQRQRVFKHDFFAATALYWGTSQKIVLKMGRVYSLFGLPLAWLGRIMTNHEMRLLKVAQGIEGIPALAGAFGPTAFAHEYIEGRQMRRDDRPGDDFFPRLAALLEELHARGMAYVDLEKPENILLGDDGNPYLIDFQISWHVPPNRMGQTRPAQLILGLLQASDRYHLMKHWRRLRPDQWAQAKYHSDHEVPIWIRFHRAVFRPLTLARRQVLVWMGVRSSIKVRSPG